MKALDKALDNSRALVSTANSHARSMQKAGVLNEAFVSDTGLSGFSDWRSKQQNREKYSLLRLTLYGCVNAIAERGAGQPIRVARVKGKKKPQSGSISGTKDFDLKQMPIGARQKAAEQEVEVLSEHPLLDSLDNPIQTKWDFIYSFLANLALTGWSYVVLNYNKKNDKWEFYSLPTTWVTPKHAKGPFSEFVVKNPNKPEAKGEVFTRDQVGFAHLPNPSNPMGAYAPSNAIMPAIRVEDHIWTSREQFFKNGIFPGSIVTVGKDPHPDAPSDGIRPRLTKTQRSQVYAAIRKVMGGVANYGNPAIVDGLIESIERLSMNSSEMGWEQSEESVKKAIRSAYRVHPFITGEPMNVGGWSQATIIKQMFDEKVNSYLNLFSNVMTTLVKRAMTKAKETAEELLVYVEECKSEDPTIEASNMKAARAQGDVSQNEFRAYLGLPADKDNEMILPKFLVAPIKELTIAKEGGQITLEQFKALLEALGVPAKFVKAIGGKKVEKPKPPAPPPAFGQGENEQETGGQQQGDQQAENETNKPEEELKNAIVELRKKPFDGSEAIARRIVEQTRIHRDNRAKRLEGSRGR